MWLVKHRELRGTSELIPDGKISCTIVPVLDSHLFIWKRSSQDNWSISERFALDPLQASNPSSDDPSAKNLPRIRRHQLWWRSVREGSVSAGSLPSIIRGSSLHRHDMSQCPCMKRKVCGSLGEKAMMKVMRPSTSTERMTREGSLQCNK